MITTDYFKDAICITSGYLFSCALGHVVTKYITSKLWKKSVDQTRNEMLSTSAVDDYSIFEKSFNKDVVSLRPPRILSTCLGIIERFFYTSAIFINLPQAIIAWLAFKALMRLNLKPESSAHRIGIGIYQIGTLVSLCFGVLGGLIALGKIHLCKGWEDAIARVMQIFN